MRSKPHFAGIIGCVFLLLASRSLAADSLRLQPLTAEIAKYGKAEFSIEVPRQYTNPFDPSEIDLQLELQSPSGRTLRVPAFYIQEYERRKISRNGRSAMWMYPANSPVWKVRFAPSEAGRYRAIARLRDAQGVVESNRVDFISLNSDDRGYIRVSEKDPRYFEFTNGQPFFPIGQNLAFIGEGQYVNPSVMPDIFEKLSRNGANFLRIWTCCQDWAMAIEARKSAWGRSWSWQPPLADLPGQDASGGKCLRLSSDSKAEVTVDPSHAVALRPDTRYVLTGRARLDGDARLRISSGSHSIRLDASGSAPDDWREFRLEFETADDEYWLGRTVLRLETAGTAWIDGVSLREIAGGPELLWEAKLNRSPRGFYNPIDCDLLDQVIAAAEKHRIYLQLCLITRDLYMGALKDDQSPEYQQAIDDAKKLLRYVVARWGYSTQVMTWEYFNEQDPGLPTDRFYHDLGEYLDEIDVYHHLRSTSTWHPSPRDWQHAQLDFADTHFYLRPAPDRKYVDEVEAALGNADELRRHAARKPALIGEFGLANKQWQPTREMQESAAVVDFHNAIWASALSGTSGTAMFWWWERLDQRDHYPHYRPLADFLAGIPWTTANLQRASVTTPDEHVRVLGLASENRAYLWLFDPRASFENIVIHKTEVPQRSGIRLQLEGLQPGSYDVQWGDTRTGRIVRAERMSVTERPLQLTCPTFQRDMACKIEPIAP